MTLYAKWDVISFTITYLDYDGRILKSEAVNYGEDEAAPEPPTTESLVTPQPSESTTEQSSATINADYNETLES